ncbi:ABC-three component system middle component 2 [Trueperella pyogenes]|uniref:ABC-three component system middle component 2 n=1 Tax=Trueperella pyogenes TaxID=1661 RepID=UPI001013BC91|nr:ABC-three component system middle component 2 [Trueperella pyogenes]
MAASLLDTAFEAELRALIFLFLLDEPVNADYLGALDTLAINQRTFGIGSANLNGTHRLAAGELRTRTDLMSQALKQLTLKGLATFDVSAEPVGFRITDAGASVVNNLRTEYAEQFFAATLDTLEAAGHASTTHLTKIITSVEATS